MKCKNIIKKSPQFSYAQKMLILHGLDILLLDGSEVLSILVFSIFTHAIAESLIYSFAYGMLRIHCGGYHSPTKTKCFLSYICMYLLFFRCKNICMTFIMKLLFSVSLIYIYVNAPFSHKLNPLSEKEYNDNKRWTHIILLVLAILFCLTKYPVPIWFAVNYNCLMCFKLKHSENYLKVTHEN